MKRLNVLIRTDKRDPGTLFSLTDLEHVKTDPAANDPGSGADSDLLLSESESALKDFTEWLNSQFSPMGISKVLVLLIIRYVTLKEMVGHLATLPDVLKRCKEVRDCAP